MKSKDDRLWIILIQTCSCETSLAITCVSHLIWVLLCSESKLLTKVKIQQFDTLPGRFSESFSVILSLTVHFIVVGL